MLSANIDCSINVEDAHAFGLLIRGSLDVSLYLVILLFLHVAVQKQPCVVFVVVCLIILLLVRVFGQPFQVGD